MLGVIGLGGVIINHAIILMDSMIHHLHADPKKPIIDIVLESAASRLRPIVLTTITTVIGMIPLALSNPTWGPFAFTVMFGLAFAICLTLVLVPVLFYRAPHKEAANKKPPQYPAAVFGKFPRREQGALGLCLAPIVAPFQPIF